MSYLRGSNYIWSDDESVHFWSETGYDGWDDTGWSASLAPTTDESGSNRAGGISLPRDIVDEFVVMHLAQMIVEGRLRRALDRALEKHSPNFGCFALKQTVELVRRLAI